MRRNQGEPKFLEEITRVVEKTAADGIEYLDDPKYEEAVRVVLSTGQASASYLQRRLKLGYSRAARLIEIMEAHGVVGPSQGSKPRDILIRAEDYRPHESIVGFKCVTMNEPFFQGHFPENPVMPGVLIVEAIAQTGATSARDMYSPRDWIARKPQASTPSARVA